MLCRSIRTKKSGYLYTYPIFTFSHTTFFALAQKLFGLSHKIPIKKPLQFEVVTRQNVDMFVHDHFWKALIMMSRP